MSWFSKFAKEWLRPGLFYGNNPLSLIGGALTSASAMTMIGFWIVGSVGHGGSNNPYLGILVDLCLPGLFLFGLFLIPVGIWIRRRRLKAAGDVPSVFPQINFGDPAFRHGVDFVIVATCINFVIVGTCSYRAVAYMDTPSFCGQACHVMAPEFGAYHVASHAGVACTECHIAPGIQGFVHAKVNGTKQLMMVILHNYPTPIMAGGKVPAARLTCVNCHNPDRSAGDKLVVKTSYGDDEKNSITQTVLVMHVGGRDQFNQFSGIHGAHLGHVEYIASGSDAQSVPWVSRRNDDGSTTEYLSSDAKAPIAGDKHLMDCIDCHNRAAHSFELPEEALNRDMSAGTPSASLPFVHKQGLVLLKAGYKSGEDATGKIATGLQDFYRNQYPAVWNGQRAQVDQASKTLAEIYSQNVFPFMKVTWGTHADNIGHTPALTGGCMRCHDGSHNARDGKSISQDCTVCHNLVATDEANPKQLTALGIP